MTVAILSAGDGYAYYTDSISRGDGAGRGQELGDYYLEAGTPPGVWVGSGIGDLGVTGVVREDQMRALFGDGLHPEADAMLERLIGEGMAPGKAVEAVRLGRKFATYKDRSSVLADRIDRALKAEAHRLGRALVAVEERHVRMREAGILYRERHGHGGSPAEVGRLLKTELGKTSKAVAGFDLTFSAPKSVSVAWALGDGDVAAAMVGAHERAITTTVAFLEREVIRSRTGTRGVAQHVTDGIVGTRFRHWESRDGDPQLHDHLVISNRVRVTDAGGRERWLTIDSRALHVGTMAASAEYNRALADELKQLGFGLRERAGSGAYRGVELACVSDGMIDRFSSRSSKIEARTVELVAGYVAEHGREPGRRAMLELRQQATLETRQGKSEPETLSGLRARWAAQAGEVAGEVTARASAELQAGAATDEIAVDVPAIAAQLADQIGWRQSSWGRHHIETMVNVWAAARPHVVPQAVRDRIVDVVLGEGSVRITPIVDVPAHAEITNPDGTSVYDSPRAWLYTSRAVLAAEDLLLDTARRLDVPAVSDRVFGAVLAGFDGPVLDQGQMDLAAQIATGEHVLTVGIGPAGAGKTTAVKVAGEAIRRAGRRVYGLATSAAAAHQLQEASGVRSETIAKFVWDATEGRGWPIGPGDVVVVDEAGMVGTRELARVVEMVTRAGGFVRLLGDDRQLQAIGTGGVLRQIDVEVGAVRLEVLHRFEDAGEGAATLRLRGDGDVAWWLENGRVHGGMGADVYGRVVDEWAANVRAGRSVLMMAGSNEQVAVLNGLAQEMLLADGRVDHGRVVELRDATTAGVGDRIVSRKNHRGLRYGRGSYVKNGDLWTVAGFRDDGVLVRNSGGQQVMLPTDYVADAVELGYASTLHRAQGATVDRALVLVDESMSREGLYVGLTRGRASNEAFVVTDGRSAAEVLRLVAGRSGAAVSARGMIEQAEREVGSPAHLVRILRDMQGRADGHRFERIVWDVMPDLAGVVLGSDRRDRLFTALARAEDAGFAADRVLRLVGQDLPVNVGDPTGLLGWRITKHLARAEQHRLDAPARPLAYLSEAQLEGMLDTAGAARRDALAVLWATRRDGQAPKDWGIGAGRCRELTVAAGEFYRAQYEGSPAQTYIRERLGTDLIGSPYQVGYAPAGWMSLVTYLRETCGATDSEIVAAGLGRMSSRGTLIDLFRDRVMFGITDHDGDLVGFVGRAGPAADKSVPKYVNSPETPIFRKSEVLFGVSEGASVLDAGGVPVRVEGPLDAIAISLAGEGRAVGVAPLGTALTREQGELLAASGPVVWSGVDADEAGRKAAGRDLALYADLGLDARELVLPVCPDGRVVKDPAELWQVDPDGLRAALGLGESAPLLAGRIVLGCLDDEAIMVHAAARVGAARDIGRIVAGLPAGQADEVVELAAGVLADRAGQPGAVDEFRAMIEAAAKDASTVVFEGRPFGWDSGVVLADRLHDVRARIGMIGGAIEETRRYAREGLGERLAGRVSRLVEERNYLLRTEVGLRAETRLRAGQDRVVSRREEEARRWQQGPSVGGPEGAVEQHATLEKALWLEAQYRTLDRDLSINDKPGNVPSWAVPGRGVQDVRQSASWAPVLGEMGGRVAAAMRKRGQELAVDADRPRWCETYLGAVPEVGSGLRERWELLAARIDTWRGLTGHSDPVRALPAPSRSRDASLDGVRDLHVLHADAADLRRDIINELVGDRSTSGVWVETPSGAVPEAGPIVRRAGLDIEPPPVVEGERVDYRAVDRARERRFAEQRLEVLGAAGGGVDVLRAVAVERAGLREPVVAGRVRERGLER